MVANVTERLETIEKIVSKTMEFSEKKAADPRTEEDHLRRIEMLSMKVEELLQQKQMALEVDDLQNAKTESIQKSRIYLEKANFEMQRN